MTTFKKKDFKKLVRESENIDELVTDDGSMISGDEKYNKGVDVKTGPINMPGDIKGIAQDTDKFRSQAVQPRNWWWSLSYGYGQGSGKSPDSVTGSNIHAQPFENGDSSGVSENETVSESDISEERMRKMVEDILSKKSDNKELVNKRNSSDVNRNNIPDIDELSDTKMIIVGKLRDLIDSMEGSNLNGEEYGIVLNFLVSNLDTSTIPSDYKNMIRKKI